MKRYLIDGEPFPFVIAKNASDEAILLALALVLSLGIVALPMVGTVEADDLPCTCNICVNQTGWWRDGGAFNASDTPIQAAVNNATEGDTICVKDGNYNENVDVNKAHLTIKSENGAANCVVSASNSGDHVFEVKANNVSISGFTVQNVTGDWEAGIYILALERDTATFPIIM